MTDTDSLCASASLRLCVMSSGVNTREEVHAKAQSRQERRENSKMAREQGEKMRGAESE